MKHLKKFESLQSDITKEDVIDYFQEYLDYLEGEKISINIKDGLLSIRIKNNSWLDGKVGLEVPKTMGLMWTKLSNSVLSISNAYGLELLDMDVNYRGQSPIDVSLIFTSPKDEKKSVITVNDIINFCDGLENDSSIYVHIEGSKILNSINEVIVDHNKNILKLRDYYETLKNWELSDIATQVNSGGIRDANDFEYTTTFRSKVRSKSIDQFPNSQIWVQEGGGNMKKVNQIILANDIKDEEVIRYIEEDIIEMDHRLTLDNIVVLKA